MTASSGFTTKLGTTFSFVAVGVLHLIGWGLLFVSANWSGAVGAITVGTGALAYMLGLRHAFDADHIAAIDNSTRKLINSGNNPGSVGLFFSLGHSTVVFTVSALIAIGLSSLGTAIADENSSLRVIGGTIGALISGSFLILIAVLNMFALLALIKTAKKLKAGVPHHELEAHLEHNLDSRGILNKLFKPVSKVIDKPWKMYPLGVLFGLGFDTASSVAMLAIAGGTAISGGNPLAIIALPVIFTAGMALGDTVDGVMMQRAYGWASGRTDRRLYYNIMVTAVSILAAIVIGLPILITLLAETFSLKGGFWDFSTSLDFEYVGFWLLAILLIIWAVTWASWKAKEQRRTIS